MAIIVYKKIQKDLCISTVYELDVNFVISYPNKIIKKTLCLPTIKCTNAWSAWKQIDIMTAIPGRKKILNFIKPCNLFLFPVIRMSFY